MSLRHARTIEIRRNRSLRSRSFHLALAAWFCASLPASAQVADEARSDAGSSPEAVRAVEALAEALREEAALPGLAVAVGTRERGIVFSGGYGVADLGTRAPATPLTRWRIGSVSKGITAAGALLLVDGGRLDLGATVAAILPDWDRRPAGRATVRQLAGHLGGIRHYRDGEGISHTHYESVADALELFAEDSLVAPPGEEYNYSTYGYTLLSAIMARATGEPFLDFMGREVFEPLGMRHTGPDLATRVVPARASFYEIRDGDMVPAPFTDNSYKWAGGGLLSTPEDLVRFGLGLLGRGLLSPASVEALFTSQRAATGQETGYGMGFRPRADQAGRRVVHHGGSSEGGRAFLLLYPTEGLVVAIAANRAMAPLFAEEAQTFAHFFLDHGPMAGAEFDRDLGGAWALTAAMGENMEHEGSLRLHDSGRIRGMLELGGAHPPIRIVHVDRHGDELRLVGTGAHGVMNAWLRRSSAGWTGNWEYLGSSGDLVLREATPGAGKRSDATRALEPSPARESPGLDACPDGSMAVEVARVAACLEEVTFPAGGLTLAGQWFRPDGPGPFAAVVVVPGSGESLRGNAWTGSLAAALVGEGVGVLIPDKRGSGRSAGDWRTASFEDLAGDAVAAVEHLGGRVDVDGARIGLMGLSQGGQIVPIAGALSDSVAFLIDVVGSAVPFVENVRFEMLNAFAEQGLAGAELEAASTMLDAAVGYVRGTVSWNGYRNALAATKRVLGAEVTAAYFIGTRDHWRWDFFRRMADFDPVVWWRRVDQPVLVLLGGADANTDSRETERRLRAAFGEIEHPDATVRVFEELGHSLWTLDGPAHEHSLHPDVRHALRSWVRRVTEESR